MKPIDDTSKDDNELPDPKDESDHDEASTARPSRRSMLRVLGASAGAVGAGTLGAGVLPAAAQAGRGGGDRGRDDGGDGRDNGGQNERTTDETPASGRFTRLFDEPAFAEPSQALREALTEIGKPGGMLDAKDDLARGAIELITEPELSLNNPNNPAHTAGITFVGQFLDHDLTSDSGSRLGQVTRLRNSMNLRSPVFDLDSLYNGGPAESPELYQRGDTAKMRIESGGLFEDLPRDDDGVAIIGDGRNDENLIISGLHAAMIKFHNGVVARVRRRNNGSDQAIFSEARRQVRWHYQWLILHEFLPAFVGQEMVDDVLRNGRKFYTDSVGQIPVEFSTSAYRFGHSMIRPSYRANMAGDNGEPFFALVFDPAEFGKHDPDDLTGRSRAPRRYIGWQTFFDFNDGEVKPNKLIDTKISTPLFQLPDMAIGTARGEDVGPTSLATRNLLRHITWQIPSGQRIAARMGVERLGRDDLRDFGDVDRTLAESTPLWLYILREAEVMANGAHLGPVGGRIVAEVFLGALQSDPAGFMRNQRGWSPTLPVADQSKGFQMTDLLTIAGVDPTTRGE